MLRVFVFVAAALALGCSPTVSPQPVQGRTKLEPNAVYFWKVTSSSVEWGACADAEDFRNSVAPLPFGPNSFLIYKTDAMAQKAKAQSCSALDPATCMDSTSGLVFDVAGTELVFTRPVLKEPLRVRDANGVERDSPCQLTQLETWTVRDQGQKFELEVTNALGLEDATPPSGECELIEANLISRSANMAGVRGCIITFKMGGELR